MPDVECYELRKVEYDHPKPGEFIIASAAVLMCGLCSTTISGHGGRAKARSASHVAIFSCKAGCAAR